jgi:hypothetical protein
MKPGLKRLNAGKTRPIRHPATGPFDPSAVYTVTVNDFLTEGGDGMPHLAGKARLRDALTMWDALIRHLGGQSSGRHLAHAVHERSIVMLQ